MRRGVRLFGTLLTIAGVLTLLWALVVWQWQDPFTALYTTWKQHQLASQYDKRTRSFRVATHAGPDLKPAKIKAAEIPRAVPVSRTRTQPLARMR